MSNLTKEKVSKLFVTGFKGSEINDELRQFFKVYPVSGVIYFQHNYHSPAQIIELTNEIQKTDRLRKIISVDQEGGRVRRFKSHFIQLPSMKELAEHDSPKLIFDLHHLVSKELASCGINLNFAPVCDVLTHKNNQVIGDRSFGSSKEFVEKMASAALRGMKTASIDACVKHFPGHGHVAEDTHDRNACDKRPQNEILDEIDIYRKMIKNKVQFIMMSHVLYPSIDADNIASLSYKIHQILINDLRYQGLIITDDLQMYAAQALGDLSEVCIKALEAGTHLLLMRDTQYVKEVVDKIVDMKSEDKEFEALIDQKIAQIQQVRSDIKVDKFNDPTDFVEYSSQAQEILTAQKR